MYVIATPEGAHVKFLMRQTRQSCIKDFNAWSPVKWDQYRKQGWKCVPVMVHPQSK